MGTFDGVHRGHRALVGSAADYAHARGLPLVVVTFTPRPDQVFAPDRALPDICSIDERCARLRAAGADDIVVLPFNRALAGASFEDFTQTMRNDFGMVALYVGEDFAYGARRAGTPEALRALGLEVLTHPLVPAHDGTGKVSSTAIRIAIQARRVARARSARTLGAQRVTGM